jgi:outer membrane receptor for ferrienterochelin and colicin
MYGTFASPRLHLRYSLAEETSIKLVAGRGFRTANVLMEQLGAWASNRRWNIQDDLQPEIATNLGLNMVSKFKLNSRDASLSLDGYFTDFENRVILDMYHSTNTVQVYNLATSGPDAISRSITVQAEFDWSVHRRLDVRTAYRWVNAQTDYLDALPPGEMLFDPFVAQHRAFTQWSYASKVKENGEQLRIDGVLQWVGPQQLPQNSINSSYHPTTTPSFIQANLQVSQTFKENFELYAGLENIFNVVHENPIVGAMGTIEGPELDQNFDQVFDASLVYGPIFGRMTYAGLRWTLGTAN